MPPTLSPTPPPTSLTARVERALFARRRLVLAAFALVTLAMAWLAAGLKVDAGLHQAGAAGARVHGDLPRAPRRVRRRGPGGDRAGGEGRGHVHAGVLRHLARGDRPGVLPARRGPHPGLLRAHPERALHRSGGGRHHRRQRGAGGLRADPRRPRPGAREHHQGPPRRPPGGQRLQRRHRQRQAPGVPSQHRRAARLPGGRGRAGAYSQRGEGAGRGGRAGGHARHRASPR